MMETFSMQRFGKLLKWRLHTAFLHSWPGILGASLGAGLIYMVIPIISINSVGQSGVMRLSHILVNVAMIFAVFSGMGILIDMKKPHDTLAELMLPGSQLEKFLSRYIVGLLYFLAMILGFWICTELFYYILNLIVPSDSYRMITPYVWQALCQADRLFTWQNLWLHTVFLVMALLFRRVGALVAILVMGIVLGGMYWIGTLPEPVQLLVNMCYISFAIVNVLGAYWAYRHIQLKDGKLLRV